VPPASGPLTPDEFRTDIGFGRIGPLYLIEGSDERLKSDLTNLIAETIDPELRAFNVERLYGSDQSVGSPAIVDAVRTMPMMAPRRIVIVLQAERVLNPKRDSEAADDALAPLAECIEQPVESTTLVFVTEEGLNGNYRLTRLLRKHAASIVTGEIGPKAVLAREIEAQARMIGVTIERDAVARLIELSNGESGKLRADTERVLDFVGKGVVTAAHVDQVAEEVERSRDDWALTRAIENRDARTALRELRVRLENGDNVFQMLGQIAWSIRSPKSRIPDSRLPAAIDALLDTDIALKSSGGNPRMLLERLIIELCG
jgi:DNA polymerase-3 subunit delta